MNLLNFFYIGLIDVVGIYAPHMKVHVEARD